MTNKERLDRHDRQIAANRNLVHEGMRLVVDTRRDIRMLAASEKEDGLQPAGLDQRLAPQRRQRPHQGKSGSSMTNQPSLI